MAFGAYTHTHTYRIKVISRNQARWPAVPGLKCQVEVECSPAIVSTKCLVTMITALCDGCVT